jgi:hypothetical protein
LQNYKAPAIFYNYRIISLLKILWNRSTVRWTQSTIAGTWVHGESSAGRSMTQIKKREGVSNNLIVAVNAGMDGSRRLSQQGCAPGLRWWLTRVSRYRCSGPPNSTWFSPTASWRRGELNSLTLGRQQTAVAAGDGEAVQLASCVDTGKLQCSFGEVEGTKGGGGPRRSFQDGRFSTGGDAPLQR